MHGDGADRRLRAGAQRQATGLLPDGGSLTAWGAGALPDDPASPPRARLPVGVPRLLVQILVAAVCAGYATGAALGWGSPRVAVFMGDFGLSAAALAAAVSCFWYARTRAAPYPPAWLLFAASSLMLALGNGVWGWYEVVLARAVPRSSLADLCFLLFAPLAIVGLLVLAKRPVSRAGWVCLSLDAWLIGGSLLTLSWSLVLTHATYWQHESVSRAALSLAYPLLDIVLVSMVLALHFRRSSADRWAINTALGGLALTVLCDALFTSPLLRETYHSGQLLDAGWFTGSILLAYAPWATGQPAPPEQRSQESPTRRPRPCKPLAGSLAAITPYLAAGVCTLGILYNAVVGREIDRLVLFTGSTVVLALVARQGIMLLDNINLTQELAQKENHFRSLVQGSSDVIMIAAPSGVLRYVSPAATGVYGRDADSLIGSQLSTFIHPDDLGRVLHEIRRFLATPREEEPSTRIECRFRHGSGAWLNIESTINRYQGGLIFNSRDVTERVRLQAQLQHSASHDALTDLPNRSLFTERVRQALSGRRSGDHGAAVLYIDLDGFKAVNDTVGHQAGDELLIHAARRLRDSVRAGDTAARLGGDEFAALILGDCPRDHGEDPEGCAAERQARVREIADRLRATLSRPYRVDGHDLRVAASIGVAFAEPGMDPQTLLRHADLAMYRAKRGGKNRVELYAPQLRAEAPHRAESAPQAPDGPPEVEFALLHQPVVELGSGRVSAVVARPRWCSPQGVVLSPEEFLADARAGEGAESRAVDLWRHVMEETVGQAAARRAAGFRTPVVLQVPLRRLGSPRLGPATVGGLLRRHGLPPGSLILELTECEARVALDDLARELAELRRLGVVIGLDGFGGGAGSVRALRRLPVDVLRLDPEMVDGLVDSPRLRKITAGVLAIASDLGLTTIADGVDHAEQVAELATLGCTHGQGLAFAGPLDDARLRRALSLGSYPLPLVPEQGAATAGAPPEQRQAGSRSVVVAGSLPARREGHEQLPPWESAAADTPRPLSHAPFEPK